VSDDETVPVVLIAGALILFPIMVYHRVRSQATGESLDRRQEVYFILFTLRPLGLGHPSICRNGYAGRESALA